MAVYSRDIAERLGLAEEEQQLAHLCGLVHDIGKIGLPAGLLEKPGALTLEERRQMQEHSAIGERILAKVEDYAEIAKIVRHHHERMDGMGYPDGIAGEEIPFLSRIIAVADAYNAMTSDRPYRDAMASRVARMRLAQESKASLTRPSLQSSRRFLPVQKRTTEPRKGQTSPFTLKINIRRLPPRKLLRNSLRLNRVRLAVRPPSACGLPVCRRYAGRAPWRSPR